jgi:hypothetical protein
MPEMPTPDDSDLKVSSTGSKAMAIAVVLIALGAVIGVLVYLQGKQKEVEGYEAIKEAFAKAHTSGYEEFWKKVQVDVKGMKSNQDFESRLRMVTAGDPVRYAKHVKEAALPILDNALASYKAIRPQPGFADKINAVVTAYEALRKAWDDFATEYLKFEAYNKAKEKLDTASSHWVGIQQQPDSEKYKYNAVRYHKLLKCILQGKKLPELDFESMETAITNTCAKGDEKPDWFRRVAFECFPRLLDQASEPDVFFELAMEASKKANDTTSKFGIDTCIKKSKDAFESDAIGKLGLPWADYVKAQNALLKAVDEKLKELK